VLVKATQQLLSAFSLSISSSSLFIKDPIIIGLFSNAGLLIGNIAGYWNFTITQFTFIYEIALFTLIGFFYLLFQKRSYDPGTLLIGGFFIVTIAFFVTLSISDSLGEITAVFKRTSEGLMVKVFHEVKHIWPIFFLITITSIISFFETSEKDRELSLQTTLFYKIFLIAAIIGGGILVVFIAGIKSKLPIIIIAILARIGLEYYLNPVGFKEALKKIKIKS
jgi:hypothetical protein